MITRILVAGILLAACSKKDRDDRAVSATGTPPPPNGDRNGTSEPSGGGSELPGVGNQGEGGSGSAMPTTGVGAQVPDDSGDRGGSSHEIRSGVDVGTTQGNRRVAMTGSLRRGKPTVTGPLDLNIIRRYIHRNVPALTACYEQRLLAREGLTGTLTTSWVIRPDGTVRDAKASGLDTEVESCFVKVISNIQFPTPKLREDVRVTYPFMVQPATE